MDVIIFYSSAVATDKLAKMIVNKRYPNATVYDINSTTNAAAITTYVGTTLVDGTYDYAFFCTEIVDADTDKKISYDQYALMRAKMKTDNQGTLVTSGTCQAGGSTSTMKLAAGSSSADDYYNEMILVCTGGTGAANAEKTILNYTGSTLIAEVGGAVFTDPAADTTYQIYNTSTYMPRFGVMNDTVNATGKGAALLAWEAVYPNFTAPLVVHYCSMQEGATVIDQAAGYKFAQHAGTAAAIGASTITLDATPANGIIATTAQIATDDYFNGMYVYIRTAPGVGQLRKITDYVGSTRVATVESAWDTVQTDGSASGFIIPTNASEYTIVSATDLQEDARNRFEPIKGRIFGDVSAKAAVLQILWMDHTNAAAKILDKLIDKDGRLNEMIDAGVSQYTPNQDLDYFFNYFLPVGYAAWYTPLLGT